MAGPDAADTVVVGRINGVWGTRGWVKIYSFTDPAIAIFDYQPWLLATSGRELLVEEWHRQGPRLVARLGGVDTPEQAAALFENEISIQRSRLPPPDAGQYYWSDLVGLEVVNLENHVYGRVQKVLATGANDVLQVSDGDGNLVLIPFVLDHYVRSVDLAAGRITVEWPLEWVDRPGADAN